jgi:hypothetical protein
VFPLGEVDKLLRSGDRFAGDMTFGNTSQALMAIGAFGSKVPSLNVMPDDELQVESPPVDAASMPLLPVILALIFSSGNRVVSKSEI